MTSLEHYQKRRELVSLHRSAIDNLSILGFVIGVSDQLVALQYVYDFSLDGLLVLRREDISDVSRNRGTEFQQSLLATEGMVRKIPFGLQLSLETWDAALSQLALLSPLLILQAEAKTTPSFVIGRLVKATAKQAEVLGFSVDGRWYTAPTCIRYSDLTWVQADTNYIRFYQRHFDRAASQ
jgi:hypothetical protein